MVFLCIRIRSDTRKALGSFQQCALSDPTYSVTPTLFEIRDNRYLCVETPNFSSLIHIIGLVRSEFAFVVKNWLKALFGTYILKPIDGDLHGITYWRHSPRFHN